jgi:hypothetical protein
VPPPSDGSELGFDSTRILFLQEDQKDAADIMQTNAVAMRQLVEAGYDPTTVTEAITSGDMTKLKHTGNVSVQLQPPGTGQQPARSAPLETEARVIEPRHDTHIHLPDSLQLEMRQEAPIVNVAAPVVNVEPTPVTVNVPPAEVTVNVEPTPVTIDSAPVTVNVPQQPQPEVFVNVEAPRTKHRVRRDNNGNIIEVIEEPV